MKHGTRDTYQRHGCRCDECRSAYSTYPVSRLTPTRIARAALCEVGRPDLASIVRPNRAGFPSSDQPHDIESQNIRARAFLIAHQSVHPSAHFHGEPYTGICCVECWPEAHEEAVGP